MNTITKIAQQRNASEASVKIQIRRKYGSCTYSNDQELPFTIEELYGKVRPVIDKPVKVNGTTVLKAEPIKEPETKTVFKNGKRVVIPVKSNQADNELTKNEQAAISLFTAPLLSVFMIAIIVISDGIAMGYLAQQAYGDQLWIMITFGMVGFAVGYIAIRSVIAFGPGLGDGIAFSFFIVQLLLHLAAYGVFNGGMSISNIIGLSVIATSISLSSVGFALSMRKLIKI